MSSQDSRVPIASYSRLRVFGRIFQFELCRVCSIPKRGGAQLYTRIGLVVEVHFGCSILVIINVRVIESLVYSRFRFGVMSSQHSHVPIAGICSRFLITCLICVGVPRRRGLGKHREEDSGWAG